MENVRNWSTDVEFLKKDREAYARWRLEQLINYGLEGEKLSRRELRKYWKTLEIDPAARKLLSLFL